MNDLIHRIVEIIIKAGQSDTKKFGLGETIRYSPSEILEILKQHENEIFGEESSTQPNTSNTLNALDCVSRAQALNDIRSLYPETPRINFMDNLAQWKKKYSQYMECEEVIKRLPSVQPEPKKGKWIGGELGYCICCGHEGCASDMWSGCEKPHCPNCGAEMEGVQT